MLDYHLNFNMSRFVLLFGMLQLGWIPKEGKPMGDQFPSVGIEEWDPWYIPWAMMLWKIGKETFKNLFTIYWRSRLKESTWRNLTRTENG